MRQLALILAAIGLLAAAPAPAAETGVALKADEIKAEPFKDAKTLGALTKGDKVEILSKQGGWLQIKGAKGNGWVRILSVKRGAAGKKDAAAELGGVAGLATGRAGTGQIVSTTGVRGLSEEQLKAAKYDEAELKKAEANAASAQAAGQFAAQAKLAGIQVAFLPEPRQSAQSQPGTSSGRR